MTKRITMLFFTLILVFALTSVVYADVMSEPAACTEAVVNGMVVGYDPDTYTAIIYDGDSEMFCTVKIDQEYGHPITTLLGSYFGNINLSDLEEKAESLASTQVCVVQDGDEWSLVPPEDVEAEGGCIDPWVLATVFGYEDGAFYLYVGGSELVVLEIEEEDVPDGLEDAIDGLPDLVVEWDLEDGSLFDVGDEIAAMHEGGVGFGVIVKLYGIEKASKEACEALEAEEGSPEEPEEQGEATLQEEPCLVVTVEDLLEMMENGMSLGQLMKMYKDLGLEFEKGVGHVRQNLPDDEGAAAEGDDLAESELEKGPGNKDKGSKGKGICNARDKGGQAKANGHGEDVCDD